MSRSRTLEPSEHQSQAAVIQWWAHACKGYGLPEFALFAIPNGANKSMAARMKFKREGLRAGVPDLFLAVHVGWAGWSGLFIEMKKVGNRPSDEQNKVLAYLKKGYNVRVCYSADQAISAIKAYLA